MLGRKSWTGTGLAVILCLRAEAQRERNDAEMVSRTKVASVIYTQTHLTANLKLIHVSVCVCVCPSRIYLRI